jgi:hypothetical protein
MRKTPGRPNRLSNVLERPGSPTSFPFERARIDESSGKNRKSWIGADTGVATAQKVLEDAASRRRTEGPQRVRDALKQEPSTSFDAQPRGKIWVDGQRLKPAGPLSFSLSASTAPARRRASASCTR